MTTENTAFWAGKTFDDFLFRPQKGMTGSRRDISLATVLTDGISLELPIVSSNMDSVTGADMARAMAVEGGTGVTHRAMTIERQARKVAQIKRSQSDVINQPLCLPLVDNGRHIHGLITRRDIFSLRERPYSSKDDNGHLRSSVSYAGEATLQAARAKILSNPEKYLIPLSESSRRESYER